MPRRRDRSETNVPLGSAVSRTWRHSANDVDGVFVDGDGDGEDFAGVVAAALDALAGDHDAAAAGDDPAGERRFLAEARRDVRGRWPSASEKLLWTSVRQLAFAALSPVHRTWTLVSC